MQCKFNAVTANLFYHAERNFALNRSMDSEGFHPTSLVYFRQRLIEKDQSRLLFGRVLEPIVLIENGGSKD